MDEPHDRPRRIGQILFVVLIVLIFVIGIAAWLLDTFPWAALGSSSWWR